MKKSVKIIVIIIVVLLGSHVAVAQIDEQVKQVIELLYKKTAFVKTYKVDCVEQLFRPDAIATIKCTYFYKQGIGIKNEFVLEGPEDESDVQLITAGKLWDYDKLNNILHVIDLVKIKKSLNSKYGFIADIIEKSRLDKPLIFKNLIANCENIDWTIDSKDGQSFYLFTLYWSHPNRKYFFTSKVWVNQKNGLLYQYDDYNSGGELMFSFKVINVATNIDIADQFFELACSKDADVVDHTSQEIEQLSNVKDLISSNDLVLIYQ